MKNFTLLLVIFLISFHEILAGDTHVPVTPIMSPETSIGTLLQADGSLNLRTGFSGSLDLSGFQVSLDECKGIVAAPVQVASTLADPWSALGTGLNGDCRVLAVDNSGNLYAGGAFTTAGGTTVNRIAKWDGTAWSALGTGLDGECYALAADNSGNLYAGGNFTTAGGIAVNSIAKWDGTAWSALSAGLFGTCSALVLDNSGNLYAGGSFIQAGTIPTANFIAKWDGTAWSALGTGLNSYCNTLTLDNSGNLYAGGAFSQAGGTLVNYIAKWDGTAWSALGTGLLISGVLPGECYALAADNSGNLYAGGVFNEAGGSPASRIAKWDGTAWSALGTGLDNLCLALIVESNGDLYAGGDFSTAGGTAASRIAKWDGATWSALGTGLDGGCYALAVDNLDLLHIGGIFTTAGGISANSIVSNSESAFPVEFLFFQGTYHNEAVQLSWATASELNNEGFQIQHAYAGGVWEEIDFVPGQGSSQERNHYQYVHHRPEAGLHHYRLKQIDYDGAFEYSNTVELHINPEKALVVYPNPTTGIVEISGPDLEQAKLTVLDLQGKRVKIEGYSRQMLDFSDLPKGMYFLKVQLYRKAYVVKIMKE